MSEEKPQPTNTAAKRGVPIVGADLFKDTAAFSNFDAAFFTSNEQPEEESKK
jgi:hypothetical protein